MFVVNDSDTPIEVAQKIICGTRDKAELGSCYTKKKAL